MNNIPIIDSPVAIYGASFPEDDIVGVAYGAPFPGDEIEPEIDVAQEIFSSMVNKKEYKKILCVKKVREVLGLSLKEAFEKVNSLEKEMGIKSK